jgi:hypothetical protein
LEPVRKITGLGVQITGHLRILEYTDHETYEKRLVNRVLLNRRNAVHKENAVNLIVNAMTNRANCTINQMWFGNGGTTLSDTGVITFKTPNVTGDANLYSPVYFQMVDDTLGAQPGNQMAVRHISNSFFTDMEIRCLIDANQPFGQLPDDMVQPLFLKTTNAPGSPPPTTQFYFDEIGLKLADGTLITHVIFVPILKTASSLIEVVYTLRMAIIAPGIPAPTPVNATVDLVGQEGSSDVGDLTVDIPPPPGEFTMGWESYASYHALEVTAGGVGINYLPTSNSGADNLGNFILGDTVVSPNGVTLYTLNNTGLWNAIDAWFGSPLVTRTPSIGVDSNACILSSINNGKYILAYGEATSPHDPSGDIFKWYALLDPQSDVANPTVLGAIGYNTFAVGVPYLDFLYTSGTGNQSDTDPIIVIGDNGFGGGTFYIELLPSPSDIKTGTYRSGWAGTNPYGGFVYGPCEIPYNFWYPISNADLSNSLYVQNQGGAFALPSAAGGTNLYLYFNEPYTHFCVTGGFLLFPCVEVQNVLGPEFPDGSIIKIELSTAPINFASITRTATSGNQHDGMFLGNSGGATATYTVDNTNWGVPFPEENTYPSQSGTVIPFEDTTQDGIATQVTIPANTQTSLAVFFSRRTGTITNLTLNLANSISGHIVFGIFSNSDNVYSQVGVTSNVLTNPSAGNITVTFGTPVPVTYQGFYFVLALSDTSFELMGSNQPLAEGVIQGNQYSGVFDSTNTLPIGYEFAQPYGSGLTTFNGFSYSDVFLDAYPWVKATYGNTTAGSNNSIGYFPMVSTQNNGDASVWQVTFAMIDPTNEVWASLRIFNYDTTGVATLFEHITGPIDTVSPPRGQVGVSLNDNVPLIYGAQNPLLSLDSEGQAFIAGFGSKTSVSAKNTQSVTFDGSTNINIASPSGAPSGNGVGTLSFWFNSTLSQFVPMMVLSGTNSPIQIRFDGSGNLKFILTNGSNSVTFNMSIDGYSGDFVVNGWHHICASWNTNLEEPFMLFWQNAEGFAPFASRPNGQTGTGQYFTLDYAACTNWNFFGADGLIEAYNGLITEVWFAPGVFINLTDVFQYQMFAGPAGPYQLTAAINGPQSQIFYPAPLGDNGEAPLSAWPSGQQLPFAYFGSNPSFGTNHGYGGTATVTGSLPDGGSSPYGS